MPRLHRPILTLAFVTLACISFGSSCGDPAEPATGTDESEIDLDRCAAWRFKCPEVKGKCDRDWVTRRYAGGALRDPAWGPCQPPPPGGCIQVILGNFGSPAGLPINESVKGYIGCPGYVVESQDKWTQYLNDRFMACVITGQVGATCNPPIKIVTPEDKIPEPGPGQRTTTREICQMMACGCNVRVVRSEVRVGRCPAPKPGKAKPKTTPTTTKAATTTTGSLADAIAATIAEDADEETCVACGTAEGVEAEDAADAEAGETCGSCATMQRPDCFASGAACENGGDCCSGSCGAGTCQSPIDPPSCQDEQASCATSGDCCTGTCDPVTFSCTPRVCTRTPMDTPNDTSTDANAIAVPCEIDPLHPF